MSRTKKSNVLVWAIPGMTVSPDEGDSLSGIYAASAEEALEQYLEDNPPAAAEEEED